MRARFNAFVDRHEIAWELGMAFLAVIFVAVGFGMDGASVEARPILDLLDLVLTIVFVAEFTTRIAASSDRLVYLRGHWVDALALLPAVRGIRLARLLRLLRLVRSFAGGYRAVMHAERLEGVRGLTGVIAAWAAVTVICCAAVYAVETGVNSAFRSPLDALWWGVETLSTVGYGDVFPVTPEGRLAASGLMLLGVGLFSVVTAIITSSLISAKESPDSDPLTLIERLALLVHQESSVLPSSKPRSWSCWRESRSRAGSRCAVCSRAP